MNDDDVRTALDAMTQAPGAVPPDPMVARELASDERDQFVPVATVAEPDVQQATVAEATGMVPPVRTARPYLDVSKMESFRTPRELGSFVIGWLHGHDYAGVRVTEDKLAAICALLVEHGYSVQADSSSTISGEPKTFTLEVWQQDGAGPLV